MSNRPRRSQSDRSERQVTLFGREISLIRVVPAQLRKPDQSRGQQIRSHAVPETRIRQYQGLRSAVPFQSLLQMKVPHRHCVFFSFAPEGPSGLHLSAHRQRDRDLRNLPLTHPELPTTIKARLFRFHDLTRLAMVASRGDRFREKLGP